MACDLHEQPGRAIPSRDRMQMRHAVRHAHTQVLDGSSWKWSKKRLFAYAVNVTQAQLCAPRAPLWYRVCHSSPKVAFSTHSAIMYVLTVEYSRLVAVMVVQVAIEFVTSLVPSCVRTA